MILEYKCEKCGKIWEWDTATISGILKETPKKLSLTEGCTCGNMEVVLTKTYTILEEKE